MKKHIAALERGRAASRLMRHPKLQPYLPKLTPHLPRLAPYASRILDEYETFGPWVPTLIDELPQLLPHMEALLDELPHLAPHLEALVAHREVLLAHIDYIVPHMPALRPHLAELAAGLPVVAQLIPRLAPHLAALLPHMSALLSRATALASVDEKLLIRIAGGESLQLLLPHLGPVAPHLDRLAPYLPTILELQHAHANVRLALPTLFANIKQLLPFLGHMLSQTERLEPRIALLRAERIDELVDELKESAPPPDEAAEEAADDGGGLWGAITRFFGGDDDTGPPRADLVKVNGAIDGAARRMAKLEEEFVTWKAAHSHRSKQQQEEALRCAKLESTLADVDDGLVRLRVRLMAIAAAVEHVEGTIEPGKLMYAKEARQTELINGGSNRERARHPPPPTMSRGLLQGLPSMPSTGAVTMPVHPQAAAAVAQGPPPQLQPRRSSLLSLVEDSFLSKMAL